MNIERCEANENITVYKLLLSNKKKENGNVIFSSEFVEPDLKWSLGNTTYITLGALQRDREYKVPKNEDGNYIEESALELRLPKYSGIFSYSIDFLSVMLGLIKAGINSRGDYHRLFKAIIPKGSKYYYYQDYILSSIDGTLEKIERIPYITYYSESLMLIDEITFN